MPSGGPGAGEAIAGTVAVGCPGGAGDVAGLVSAIAATNTNPGPDTIQLAAGCTYALTAVDNYWYGPDGLPPVAGELTIDGRGATISRAGGAPPFRLFFVSADPATGCVTPLPHEGKLTLREVTLSGGLAMGGDSTRGGGGGAGMGGAIFNQGSCRSNAAP